MVGSSKSKPDDQPSAHQGGPSKGERVLKRLHISGLQADVTSTDLVKRFSSFGDVGEVEGLGKTDGTGRKRPYAFLTISTTPAQLSRCMNLLSGSTWQGSTLRIAEARPDYLGRHDREVKEEESRLAAETDSKVMKKKRKRALEKIRKRKRGVEGYESVGVKNGELVDRDNVKRMKGWILDPKTQTPIIPLIARPTHPLPPMPSESATRDTKKDKDGITPRKDDKVPTRARRVMIDPRKWGATHLKGEREIENQVKKKAGNERSKVGKRTSETVVGIDGRKPREDTGPSDHVRIVFSASPPPFESAVRPPRETAYSDEADGVDFTDERRKQLDILQSILGSDAFGQAGGTETGFEEVAEEGAQEANRQEEVDQDEEEQDESEQGDEEEGEEVERHGKGQEEQGAEKVVQEKSGEEDDQAETGSEDEDESDESSEEPDHEDGDMPQPKKTRVHPTPNLTTTAATEVRNPPSTLPGWTPVSRFDPTAPVAPQAPQEVREPDYADEDGELSSDTVVSADHKKTNESASKTRVEFGSLKDVFKPQVAEGAFSIGDALSGLDLDLDLEMGVEDAEPSQPVTSEPSAAGPSYSFTASTTGAAPPMRLDPNLPLFFPFPLFEDDLSEGGIAEGLDGDEVRRLKEKSWVDVDVEGHGVRRRFKRVGTTEEIMAKHEERRRSLTEMVRKRHKEAVKRLKRKVRGTSNMRDV